MKPVDNELDASEMVHAYHAVTKHHYHQHARSLGYLDWATQPHPFRYYEGTDRIQLPLNREPPPHDYDQLFVPDGISPLPLNLDAVADFFRYSVALTAWKQSGPSRWALRANPSSGNLHPTEAYAILVSLGSRDHESAIYHYVSETHSLERRATCSSQFWDTLMRGSPPDSFVIGLTSVVWREAWKYGERAFRYCQHDVGHAVAALRFSAVLCGWTLKLVSTWSSDDVAALLGVDRQQDFVAGEAEEPELLAIVVPNDHNASASTQLSPLNEQTLRELRASSWHGKANQLSPDHVDWPIIDEVASTSRMPRGVVWDAASRVPPNHPVWTVLPSNAEAHRIIHQRRSCLALDGQSAVSLDIFLRMLARTFPGAHPPWDALCWPTSIHLALFVHRVDGLAPGLYTFVRDPSKTDTLRSAMRETFTWSTPPGVRADFPLYLLQEADCRSSACMLSCNQDIASDGFFSLGMIAEFDDPIRRYGPWFYRNLFWEAGIVGQVLYLEAEAAEARSTGIGCYYDDPVHAVLGLTGSQFQSLYHFTVGIPLEDNRLQTSPPYGPMERG